MKTIFNKKKSQQKKNEDSLNLILPSEWRIVRVLSSDEVSKEKLRVIKQHQKLQQFQKWI